MWSIAKGSNTITTLGSFSTPHTSIGVEPYGGVTPDAQANLYGTTNSSGSSEYGKAPHHRASHGDLRWLKRLIVIRRKSKGSKSL